MSPEPPTPAVVAAEPSRCSTCQSPTLPRERYCETCGSRLAAPPDVERHPAPAGEEKARRMEIDLGTVAAVSDRGRRRRRNEDSVSVAADGGRSVAVVCDGVASTDDAHRASQLAARAARGVLEQLTKAPRWPVDEVLLESFRRAFAEAQSQVCTLDSDEGVGTDRSPSTTLVAAVTAPGHLAVAGVGDSRAYWLVDPPESSRLLTVDDSWAEEQIAGGVDPTRAYGDPEAHTITRWIGAGAGPVDVDLTIVGVSEPGLLVLCSDGLWNYFEAPERLAREATGSTDRSPLGIARHLMRAALRAGGHDNVTVAVLPLGPEPSEPGGNPATEEG